MEKVVFVGDMENGSKSSSQRQRKSARDLREKHHKHSILGRYGNEAKTQV